MSLFHLAYKIEERDALMAVFLIGFLLANEVEPDRSLLNYLIFYISVITKKKISFHLLLWSLCSANYSLVLGWLPK